MDPGCVYILLYRQQELEAEAQVAECSRKAKKEHLPAPPWTESDKDIFFQSVLAVCSASYTLKIFRPCWRVASCDISFFGQLLRYFSV